MQAAHDAQGHRALQAVGGAQGNRPIAHLQSLRITEGSGLHARAHRNAHHGQIRDGIGPEHPPLQLTTIGEAHLHPISPIHHVGIGEHQALGIDHDPRSLAPLPGVGHLVAEQLPQQRVVKGGIQADARHAALGVDPHHRWSHPLHRAGHKTVAGTRAIGPGRCRQPQAHQQQQR